MTSTEFLIWAASLIVGVVILYHGLRYIYSVDTRIKQNKQIIELLKAIAEKQGVSNEKIETIVPPPEVPYVPESVRKMTK
jgi:hypothetical protein